MRGFYEMQAATDAAARPPRQSRLVRLVLNLAVLAYWLPCGGIDLYIVWRGGGRDGVGAFVFWLLYRQSLVFLALWFAGALAHGLTLGRRTPAEPRRKRRRSLDDVRTAQSAGMTLSRHTRGI